MCLEKEIKNAIDKFPNTSERIESTLMFCAHLLNCNPKDGQRASMNAGAYFRAALAEYASIEEILNQELPSGKPRFRLLETDNPLPHILKQLRNLQFHLVASKISDSMIALWLKLVPSSEPVDVSIWTISDLTERQFKRLQAFSRSRKGYYNQNQAVEMVQWVNTNQMKFGIHAVIYRGVREAAQRIVTTYAS